MAGHDIRAFGRDTGRSEGRRHHVDSHEYKAEDGSKRLRVRFNIKGDKSQLVVYAEVRALSCCAVPCSTSHCPLSCRSQTG